MIQRVFRSAVPFLLLLATELPSQQQFQPGEALLFGHDGTPSCLTSALWAVGSPTSARLIATGLGGNGRTLSYDPYRRGAVFDTGPIGAGSGLKLVLANGSVSTLLAPSPNTAWTAPRGDGRIYFIVGSSGAVRFVDAANVVHTVLHDGSGLPFVLDIPFYNALLATLGSMPSWFSAGSGFITYVYEPTTNSLVGAIPIAGGTPGAYAIGFVRHALNAAGTMVTASFVGVYHHGPETITPVQVSVGPPGQVICVSQHASGGCCADAMQSVNASTLAATSYAMTSGGDYRGGWNPVTGSVWLYGHRDRLSSYTLATSQSSNNGGHGSLVRLMSPALPIVPPGGRCDCTVAPMPEGFCGGPGAQWGAVMIGYGPSIGFSGVGCPIAGGTPTISCNLPVGGQVFSTTVTSSGTPNAPSMLTLGFSNTFDLTFGTLPFPLGFLGVPACSLQCSLDITALLMLDSSGVATWSANLPPVYPPGILFHVQAAVGNGLGIGLSNLLTAFVGP